MRCRGGGKNMETGKTAYIIRGSIVPNPRLKLLDQVREVARLRHFSIRTEQAYAAWIRRFILFHGKRHPRELSGPEVTVFLTHLAVREKVSASTQNQALNALLFLYREVMHIPLEGLGERVRATRV